MSGGQRVGYAWKVGGASTGTGQLMVETRPDRFDLIGAAIYLVVVAAITYARVDAL